MNVVPSDWSERHKELNRMIRKEACFAKATEMVLNLHCDLHTSRVSNRKDKNRIDELFGDLKKNEYAVMPTSKDETIAWAVWHIARIEDLTMNILVNNGTQIFNQSWQNRLNVTVTDTGNAMTDDEIMQFSKNVCVGELLQYRDAVGIQSREIIRNLKPADMRRKVSPERTARILQESGVTEQEDSVWLLDFWGKKDVAGILLMPLTRHQTLHLNDCCRWKKIIRERKKFFAV